MNIIKLESKDWEKYKDIRLEALKSEPLAFAQMLEEAAFRSEQAWIDDLISSQEKDGGPIYFAEDSSKIIGMAGAYIEKEKLKLRHVANIWGVYISRIHRGKGAGKKLLQTLIKDLELRNEIKKIKLAVNPIQKEAFNLYKALGFEEVGKHKNELKIGDKYYDEILLEKLI